MLLFPLERQQQAALPRVTSLPRPRFSQRGTRGAIIVADRKRRNHSSKHNRLLLLACLSLTHGFLSAGRPMLLSSLNLLVSAALSFSNFQFSEVLFVPQFCIPAFSEVFAALQRLRYFYCTFPVVSFGCCFRISCMSVWDIFQLSCFLVLKVAKIISLLSCLYSFY